MKDYYKILGINKNASLDDIKMAYKKLAMKYHPDRNPNNPKSEEKFKEVKEAYEFLTNKNPSTPSFDFNSENINFTDFTNTESSLDDIFNVIFQKSYKKDNKVYFLLDIDLESSFYGSTIDIKIPYKGYCDTCFGKGSKPGTDMKICPKCYGAGMYNMMQGIFSFRQKCYKCNGKGYVFVEYCNFCSGSGKINKYINHTLFVDKNSDNNTLISLKNLKCKGFNFDNYFILLKLKKHSFFFRKNKTNDLYINYYLDFIKSIFGGYIKVPTLYGCVLYKINKYNQFGKIYKLSTFGLSFKKKNGDLYFVLIVEIISNLNYYQWLLFNKIKIQLDYNFNYFYFLKNNSKINSFYKLVLNF